MSHSTTTCRQPADDLLYGFDIPDEDTKEFLASLVASGQAPQAEINALRELSLMRGVEEWDMLFQCALTLRAKHGEPNQDDDGSGGEASLVPFLDAVLLGRDAWNDAASTARGTKAKGTRKAGLAGKRALGKEVSHFWGEEEGTSGTAGWRRRSRGDHSPASRCLGSGQDKCVTEGIQADEPDGDVDCVVAWEAQGIAPTSQPAGAESSAVPEKISSCLSTKDSTTPTRANSGHPEAPRDTERAVKATGGSKSPFFGTSTPTPTRASQPNAGPTPPSTKKKKPRPPRGTVSSLPVPPLSTDRFGLIQEELADDPFRLLIAITFLIRTTGKAAIPVFRQLMERFPSPETLAAADPAEIVALIHPLGLSAVRCAAVQKYARVWLERMPSREVRYGVKNYPLPGDGRHVKAVEEFGPEDGDGADVNVGVCPVDAVADARDRAVGCAWEIGHLTQGPYALDSWRIFCRDVLLGRSGHWTGKGGPSGFQPEWMRVLPRDKELRACLRWMWMREGWEWDPLTGEREPLRDELRRAVDDGRVGYDGSGNLVMLDLEIEDTG
ncbi:DNA glycosylase [Parathielavia hyrcaniae]|uniref:DNA glycosylase n=1 Tax=Parathielavia hyrcaniae TaxID=113614 RepID=A0AAN6T2K1_9PEZI|nr:DNA glycosylase [Parathielavia hyrcaniae]